MGSETRQETGGGRREAALRVQARHGWMQASEAMGVKGSGTVLEKVGGGEGEAAAKHFRRGSIFRIGGEEAGEHTVAAADGADDADGIDLDGACPSAVLADENGALSATGDSDEADVLGQGAHKAHQFVFIDGQTFAEKFGEFGEVGLDH